MANEQENIEIPSLAGADINTISKETADGYVKNWKTGSYTFAPVLDKNNANQLQLDSFVFSINDFKDYVARVDAYNLNNPTNPITGTVCRIGIKPLDIIPGNPVYPGLFFEPVVGFTRVPLNAGSMLGDIPPLKPTTPGEVTSARYDFSYPCPPTCPVIGKESDI